MGKALAILGILVIIIGLLPLWGGYLSAYYDLSSVIAAFNLGLFAPIPVATFFLTDLSIILLGVGFVLLIIGALR
jgi:hypothetical protein